jgi:hypothetical protein
MVYLSTYLAFNYNIVVTGELSVFNAATQLQGGSRQVKNYLQVSPPLTGADYFNNRVVLFELVFWM